MYMSESIDSLNLKERILSQLKDVHAVGEGKLREMILSTDNSETSKPYLMAIRDLYKKGIIDIVADKSDTMNVIRLKGVLH